MSNNLCPLDGMYVCMYVCMYGWMYGWMYVCMYVKVIGRDFNLYSHFSLKDFDPCICNQHICMYIYVCVYIYIYI